MIEIVPYQNRWPEEFAAIASKIRETVGDSALRIDHIGSTSVPNLAAKDILDVMMTLQGFKDFERLVAPIKALGYEYVARYNRDHPRAGVISEPRDWEKRYFRTRSPRRPVHFHIRAAGRANQRYALLFRDYLRAIPEAAAGYAALKHQLARYHGQSEDHSAYVDIKDPVCDIIMTGAEAWAAVVGWKPGPTDS